MKVYTPEDVEQQFGGRVDPSLWTVVIPAAGRGSRLGYDKPKILYPIAGTSILERLIKLFEPYCSRFILVCSPAGGDEISLSLQEDIKQKFEIVIQKEPIGMADAIYQALPSISTRYTVIVWGDQVALHSTTVHSTLKIHEKTKQASLTLPLVKHEDPYTHYERDSDGSLARVLQKREGARMPVVGDSDCGLFAVTTSTLREIFTSWLKDGQPKGEKTGEWNFLPMLPQFEGGGESVQAFYINSAEEAVGVNDSRDVAVLEKYFKKIDL